MRKRECFEGDDEVFVVLNNETGYPEFFGVCHGDEVAGVRADVEGVTEPTGYTFVREPLSELQRFKEFDITFVPAIPAQLVADQLVSA